jgi:uncharacterized protein (DUF924 family)
MDKELQPATITDYWLGDVMADITRLPEAFKRWFGGGEALDRDIADRFGTAVRHALDGGFVSWEQDVQSRVALVILLDQFPRNIFRHAPEAFAGDARALRLAQASVESGHFRELSYPEQVFLLMPYQHAEDIDVQDTGVTLFGELEKCVRDAAEPTVVVNWLVSTREYAELHRDIVQQFGRFPHRNDVLGREHTDEERTWLENSGQRFGQ